MTNSDPFSAQRFSEIGDQTLAEALREANIPTLLLVLRQLTGDDRWMREPYRPKRGRPLDDNDSGGLTVDLQEEVRSAALRAVVDFRAGVTSPTIPSPQEITEMLAVTLGEDVPAEYGGLLSEEMGFSTRDIEIPTDSLRPGFKALVIGAGLSGICMAIKLAGAGVNFAVLEKDEDLGGTWLENVYPGCGVDTPGHLYTFSFAPNPDITRYFAKRDEVHRYIENLADQHGIREHIQFSTEVVRATYEESDNAWRVEVRQPDGSAAHLTADVLISAVGMVNRPFIPPIRGLGDFPGPVMHTATWDPAVDVTGKTVAVVGTGASAMQLVPSIAGIAARVAVFQRSKQWAVPHPNYHRPVHEAVRVLMREVPFYFQWYRLRSFWNFSDRLHPSLQIDPDWLHPDRSVNEVNERHRVFLTKYITEQLEGREDLIEASLPDYPPYGKRPLLDNNWYKTLLRDDVQLITAAVDRVDGDTLVTSSGERLRADIVVLATGFKVLQFLWPMDIVGRSGRTLREQWGVDDARAYLGVTVPDFPNFFVVNGPNTNAGHGGSAIHPTEFQVRYVMQAIRHLLTTDTPALEVDEDVFRRYNDELDEALSSCIWSHKGMTTYYRNGAGRIVVSSPWTYVDYWNRTLALDATEYHSPLTAAAAE